MTVSLACDCLRREREISLRVGRVLAILENQRTAISSQRSEINWPRGGLGESALGAAGAIALTLLMSARAAFALPVTCTRDKLGGEVVSSTNCPSDRGNYRKRRCCSCGFRFRVTRAKGGCRRRRIAARNRSWPTRAGADFGFCSWLEHRRSNVTARAISPV